jgi:hypothetical protein
VRLLGEFKKVAHQNKEKWFLTILWVKFDEVTKNALIIIIIKIHMIVYTLLPLK